jgi:hypothetical protein
MKKPIIVSMIMALTLLVWGSFAPAQPQDPTKEEKPTFYRLTPGVYVNGWPRFTITYPKDWVEEIPHPLEVFRASDPDPIHGEGFIVDVYTIPPPIDSLADRLVFIFKNIGGKDVIVVSDKPSQLRDGTPAQEVELQMVQNNLPLNYFSLATKKGDIRVTTGVASNRGRIREDLKAILYSLEFQPGKDELVKVPPDIQGFFDKYCSDVVSHDLAKVMLHYSDRYLHSGSKMGEVERFHRQFINSTTSFEVGITDFVPAGDKFYLTGFVSHNGAKFPLSGTSIIKENGEWKWYGNQRDVSP